jgi:TolB-like protein/tetratricopeptide (TPR) repeat protein
MPDNSFFRELRRRKVVQAAAIYGAVAWGVTEVVVTVVEQLFLPQWVSTLAVIGFVVGFPVAMFLAWTFDITADGIQRTALSSRRGKASIAASMALLVAGTAGLFLLIRPALQYQQDLSREASILPNSVAVLPFENAGLDPRDAYLNEGLSDELRDQLGRIPELRIAARSSSLAAHQTQAGAMSVSAQLGVAMLVEGSVRQRGNGLRVSVQLIEGNTGLALWSETYDRGVQELLSVQQAIAEEVIRRILPDTEVADSQPVTRNATANELLLLARYYEQQVRMREEVDRDTLLEAIRLYREATEADPESALANSRLAGALLYLGDLQAAEAPIFKALSLNPELSEVQYTLGLYYFARGLTGAGAAFKRAADLNPNSPDALESYANWSWMQGRTESSEALLRRAVELDPLSLGRYGALGTFLGVETTPDKTLALIGRIETMFDGPEAYRLIGQLLELTGQVDQAIAWTIRARDLDPGNPDHVYRLAELYGVIGDFDTALRLEPEPGIGLLYRMRRYEELIDIAELLMIEEPGDMPLRYLLAFAYNATGQFESALRVLKSAGLPDSILEETRFSADMEGFITLMNAAYGAGNIDVARELAMFWANRHHPVNIDWWQDANGACAMSVLEFHAEALARLERIRNSPRLPWDPVLKDAVCFQRYSDEPVYQETVRHVDARRAALRERLPATLAEFGVSL